MPPAVKGLDFSDPVLRAYAFYSSILVVKLFSMVILTGRQRFRKKVFSNPEDLMSKASKIKLDDPDVERVRRAHLNDLENIPAFWVVGLLYCATNPSPILALNLFRLFTACRIAHTFFYAVYPAQPFRALAFGGGLISTLFMTVSTIIHFA